MHRHGNDETEGAATVVVMVPSGTDWWRPRRRDTRVALGSDRITVGSAAGEGSVRCRGDRGDGYVMRPRPDPRDTLGALLF